METIGLNQKFWWNSSFSEWRSKCSWNCKIYSIHWFWNSTCIAWLRKIYFQLQFENQILGHSFAMISTKIVIVCWWLKSNDHKIEKNTESTFCVLRLNGSNLFSYQFYRQNCVFCLIFKRKTAKKFKKQNQRNIKLMIKWLICSKPN